MIDAIKNATLGAGQPAARLRLPVLMAALVALTMACSGLLDVRDPDVVTPENLGGEAGLAVLRAGAFGDLAIALSGSAAGHGATPGLILHSAVLADEMVYSGTFPTRRQQDERNVLRSNGTMLGVFQRMHRARTALRTAAETIEEFSASPSTDPRIAEMWSLTGFMYIMFGETYCSGVPFSTANVDGTLDFGSPQTTTEMFQNAVARAATALANTGGSADQESFARMVNARALLNMGDFSGAAAMVATVADGFVYNLEHSLNTFRQQNGIYILSTVRRQYSVSENVGINGLAFRSALDPRVPWDDPGRNGQDDQTPYFNQLKYPDEAAPVPLATGTEARLIEAEALLQASDPSWLTVLTDLRANSGLDFSGVPGLVDGGGFATNAANVDLLFSERAFWLWVTGHRQGDLRRLVRQYGRGSETVFPTGAYFKGGLYGPDLNFPLPLEEDNNPNSSGCLDRGA